MRKYLLPELPIYSSLWRDRFRGGQHLLMEDFNALPPGKWDDYIEQLQPFFVYPMALADIGQLPLSPEERNQLMDGQIVVREGATIFHQRILESDKAVTMGPLERENNDPNFYRDLTSGHYHLFMEDLKAMSPENWKGYIRNQQPYFGYPISLDDMSQLALSPTEHDELRDGWIVVKHDEDGMRFHRRVLDSDKVLTMGPSDGIGAWNYVIIWCTFSIMFGSMALIWALPFWLRLKKVILAAQAFGRGEFDARANLPRSSALSPLAATFNDMAGRIQRLINSHRELTRAVSNELRTPISRIRFGLEMANTADSEPDRRLYLAEIGQAVDELESLVAELLIYARFERETPELDQEEQCLAPWLIQTVNTAKNGFLQIDISCRIEPVAKDLTAKIAPRYMARAVSNLVTNAGRHAKSQIIVSLEKKDHMCMIHVDDDGPGIAKADRKRIFEPFVRLDASRDRDTGGSGLGLAIVQRIVTMHRGAVLIEPSPLGGARFTVHWPSSMSIGSAMHLQLQHSTRK
ncbi:ATP-binding protein [Desulfosarcina variabilis]|uniref:ATP-binding protein n=1 Tax=Desulfosarcina variabilis TaxID=2300 RepID=UPI003AFB4E1D